MGVQRVDKRMVLGAILVAGLVSGLTGCAQSGMFLAGNVTNVQLGQSDYKVVATDLSGTAQAAYLLGLTLPGGMVNNTLALARIQGTGMLYKEALADLWANFEKEHGPVAGRKLALVNVRYDGDNINLLVYCRPKLSIRADVVEFASAQQ